MKNKNIFEKLHDMRIPYVVGVANFMLKKSDDVGGHDYFIAVPNKFKEQLNDLYLFNSNKTPANNLTLDKSLSQDEYNWFKENKENYKMVINSSDGIIYEPKHVSLKEFINKKTVLS